MAPSDVRLAHDVDLTDAAAAIGALNADPSVAGIVVIYPVPAHLDPDAVGGLVDPAKDVDGASPVDADRLAHGEEAFVPATALAVLEILRHHQVPIAGRRVVVVGRSKVVGQPTAALLANHGAEVTVAHSETRDVVAETQAGRDPGRGRGEAGPHRSGARQRPNGGGGLRHQRHAGRRRRRRGLRRACCPSSRPSPRCPVGSARSRPSCSWTRWSRPRSAWRRQPRGPDRYRWRTPSSSCFPRRCC